MVVIYAVVVAAFVALALPASAITVQGGNEEAWAIVNRAEQDNQKVLDDFTARALSAETQEELLEYEANALAALDAIYNEALADLNALALLLGGQIDWTILLAKDALKQNHDIAVREVKDLTQSLLPTLPSGSTTTTSTSTTTTTKPTVTTTTTTKPRETTTTTTQPADTTTTQPSVTTTTQGGSVTTTTSTATTTTRGGTTTTEPAAGGGSGGEGSGGGTDDPALAAPPVIGDAATLQAPSSEKAQEMREERSVVSSMLTANASVALPPAVVAAGAAPFIVLEVILGTLFESLAALVFPFLMLVFAVAILIWRESRRPTVVPRL